MHARKPLSPRVACRAFVLLAAMAVLTPSCASTRASVVPSVTLEPVDGGLDYYGRFAHPLSTSSSFFPVGVWGANDFTPEHVAQDKATGINLYVWNADTAAWGQDNIRAAGLRTFQDVQDQANIGSQAAGWLLGDETDMNLGPGWGPWNGQDMAWGNCTNFPDANGDCGYTAQQTLADMAPDARLKYANYGKGILFWESDAEAEVFVNRFQDVSSADAYWFTDDDLCTEGQGGTMFNGASRALTTAECRRASNYGALIDRERKLDAVDGARHPIWGVVEVGCPMDNGNCIEPAQARAAVWHSLIAGARAVLYFQHSFSGPCVTSMALRASCYQSMIDTITSTNAQIETLAPVLNAPTVTSQVTTSDSIRSMVKWQGGHFYVFAGSRENTASAGTVSLPCIGDATATVVDENRTVPVLGGTLSDSFTDGDAIHIYRIDGGSSCGLSDAGAEPMPGGGPPDTTPEPTPGAGPPDTSPEPTPGAGLPDTSARPMPGVGSPSRTRSAICRVAKRPSLGRGRLVVRVWCAAPFTADSRLTTKRGARRVRLAAVRRRFAAGRHRLVLRLDRRARRLIARARRPPRMRLRTVIVEAGGARTQRTQHLVTHPRAAARR